MIERMKEEEKCLNEDSNEGSNELRQEGMYELGNEGRKDCTA